MFSAHTFSPVFRYAPHMPVILEATAGPVAGRKIEVHAGTILRVGRTAKSDYIIGEDHYLSGQHFAAEYDGIQCRIRDLGSSNGTFVNGDRVTEIAVRDGDSITAGGSTFLIRLTIAPDPPVAQDEPSLETTANYTRRSIRIGQPAALAAVAAEAGAWPGFSASQSALLQAIFREGETICAVLDGSRDSRIPAFLDASGDAHAALETSGQVPAYVVSLSRKSRLLDVLVKDGWGRGWGFYCATRLGLEQVCVHWRDYLFLTTGGGMKITFRFWDPRVLRALVPSMPVLEAANFFGPLSRIIVEGDKSELALDLSVGPHGVRQQTLMLI